MIAAIERTLELDAPIDDVWRALTDPSELSGWFGDTTELNPCIGASGWFGWQEHGRFAVEVEEFEPPHRFVWLWSHRADTPLAESRQTTRVEWSLEPREGGGTLLHLRESGFTTEEQRSENDGGWTAELAELEAHLAAA